MEAPTRSTGCVDCGSQSPKRKRSMRPEDQALGTAGRAGHGAHILRRQAMRGDVRARHRAGVDAQGLHRLPTSTPRPRACSSQPMPRPPASVAATTASRPQGPPWETAKAVKPVLLLTSSMATLAT